jgi:hypothetical protein
MPRFEFFNRTLQPISVAIEPWAEVEVAAPQGNFALEYAEPAELCIDIYDDGTAGISINSDHIGRTSWRSYRGQRN